MTSSVSHWRQSEAPPIFTSLRSRRNVAERSGVSDTHAGRPARPVLRRLLMAVFVRILPAAALLVATAASLGAQQAAATPPACDATQPTNASALKASLTLQSALKTQKTDPAGAAKNLTSTVKALDAGDKAPDAATAYAMGSALALWMNQPGIGLTPKRSAL